MGKINLIIYILQQKSWKMQIVVNLIKQIILTVLVVLVLNPNKIYTYMRICMYVYVERKRSIARGFNYYDNFYSDIIRYKQTSDF